MKTKNEPKVTFIPAEEVHRIQEGERVRIVDDFNKKVYEGKVVKISRKYYWVDFSKGLYDECEPFYKDKMYRQGNPYLKLEINHE